MQFTDFLFSTDKLVKPIIITLLVGFLSLVFLTAMGDSLKWQQSIISKTVFVCMCLAFGIARYRQAKKMEEEYLERKKSKRRKKESEEE